MPALQQLDSILHVAPCLLSSLKDLVETRKGRGVNLARCILEQADGSGLSLVLLLMKSLQLPSEAANNSAGTFILEPADASGHVGLEGRLWSRLGLEPRSKKNKNLTAATAICGCKCQLQLPVATAIASHWKPDQTTQIARHQEAFEV